MAARSREIDDERRSGYARSSKVELVQRVRGAVLDQREQLTLLEPDIGLGF